jgi:hypothetical protein
MMANTGEGYEVRDVPELGDEAAMALTLPDPRLAIPGGLVAELYVRKGDLFLLLAPVRLEIRTEGPGFDKFMVLTREMLDTLQ